MFSVRVRNRIDLARALARAMARRSGAPAAPPRANAGSLPLAPELWREVSPRPGVRTTAANRPAAAPSLRQP
jgi:hypothetical protein